MNSSIHMNQEENIVSCWMPTRPAWHTTSKFLDLCRHVCLSTSSSPRPLCTPAQLVQALEWCLELGVPCVSVYAFSLENFNRSAAEVAVLMDLAERKLLAILQVVMRPQHAPVVSLQAVPAAASDGRYKVSSAEMPWLCAGCAACWCDSRSAEC
jgi:Putative undecaprenyl diphosphate synthase